MRDALRRTGLETPWGLANERSEAAGSTSHANFQKLLQKIPSEVDCSFEDTTVNLSSITTCENDENFEPERRIHLLLRTKSRSSCWRHTCLWR